MKVFETVVGIILIEKLSIFCQECLSVESTMKIKSRPRAIVSHREHFPFINYHKLGVRPIATIKVHWTFVGGWISHVNVASMEF